MIVVWKFLIRRQYAVNNVDGDIMYRFVVPQWHRQKVSKESEIILTGRAVRNSRKPIIRRRFVTKQAFKSIEKQRVWFVLFLFLALFFESSLQTFNLIITSSRIPSCSCCKLILQLLEFCSIAKPSDLKTTKFLVGFNSRYFAGGHIGLKFDTFLLPLFSFTTVVLLIVFTLFLCFLCRSEVDAFFQELLNTFLTPKRVRFLMEFIEWRCNSVIWKSYLT